MFIRPLAQILCRVFFRRISVSGTPYLGNSALWCANHTSGIVDPAIMIGLSPVPLRPIAKNSLFDHLAMRPLLKASRAIGVSRVQDMKPGTTQNEKASGFTEKEWRAAANQAAFKSVVDGLHQGDRILIFPEGLSHDEPYVHPFKTGLARMALQAMSSPPVGDFSVVIQPVAIDYFEKDEFRSDVAFHFCEPILITNSDSSVEEISFRVHESLTENLAQFQSWDEKRNWLFTFAVAYGRPAASAREFKLFFQEHREIMEGDTLEWSRLQTFRRLLSAWEIPPHSLVWGEAHERRRSFYKLILIHGWFHVLVSGPLVTLGTLFWYLPISLISILANQSTKERDVIATMKLAHGSYILPLWVLIQGFLSVIALHYVSKDIPPFWSFMAGIMFGPLLLILSIVAEERTHFFPGYWRLAKLRLFFPRGWREVMIEWKLVSSFVNQSLKSRSDKHGLDKVLQINQHITKLNSKWLSDVG